MENRQMTMDEKLLHQLRSCGHFLRFQTGGKGGQRRILSILAEKGSMTQRELMELVEVRSGSLSEILAKIEDQGFIARTQNEQDKRNVDISLTEEGKAHAESLKANHAEMVAGLFSGLSEEEKQQLLVLMEKLRNTWEKQGRLEELRRHDHGHHHGPGGCKGHGHGGPNHHHPHDA